MDVETIVQGGAVGLSVFLIFVVWQVVKMNNKTINNHLDHIEKSNLKRAESDSELAKSLQQLASKMDGCPYNKLNT